MLFWQDTVARLPAGVHATDTVVLRRFAPAPVVQFLFQQPPLLMWTGVVIALVLLGFALRWFWPRRQAVRAWYQGWSRGAKTPEEALETLESYRDRYRPIADLAGISQ